MRLGPEGPVVRLHVRADRPRPRDLHREEAELPRVPGRAVVPGQPGVSVERPARPMVVAHRGASIEQPENTIEAFEAAIDAGADAVEFDVRMTADGHAVVMHDPDVSRTTDGTGLVSEMTLEEIRKLGVPTLRGSPAMPRRPRRRRHRDQEPAWRAGLHARPRAGRRGDPRCVGCGELPRSGDRLELQSRVDRPQSRPPSRRPDRAAHRVRGRCRGSARASHIARPSVGPAVRAEGP